MITSGRAGSSSRVQPRKKLASTLFFWKMLVSMLTEGIADARPSCIRRPHECGIEHRFDGERAPHPALVLQPSSPTEAFDRRSMRRRAAIQAASALGGLTHAACIALSRSITLLFS